MILDKQKTFDMVIAHAKTMNRLAMTHSGAPLYYVGNKPGCLMYPFIKNHYNPHSYYRGGFEHLNIEDLIWSGKFGESPEGWTDQDTQFLKDLQAVHDDLTALVARWHDTDDEEQMRLLWSELHTFAQAEGLKL